MELKVHHEKQLSKDLIAFSIKAVLCDDCFQEAIKGDLVLVGKKLMHNRWHKPTEADSILYGTEGPP